MKNQIELLAPAGNYEIFEAAIQAGANAVYVSGKMFGARSFADNFSNEDLAKAVRYAHLHNAKLYVTVNTMIFEDEIKLLDPYLSFLSDIKVDAVIVQDLGVMRYIRMKYPKLVIHASTQVNILGKNGIEILKRLGVERVVLGREVSLDEIETFSSNDMELEVFIHGALCFSSSGNCLMSSAIGGRSGNRGKCAQPCRKKYSLLENNKTIVENESLMSMKDLISFDALDRLINANVSSLKIEGRMKRKEYVYSVVSAYRKAIDSYYKKKKVIVDPIDLKNIKITFNREFTKGYLQNELNNDLVNHKFVNHHGITLGRVINSNKFNCTIKLMDDLNIHDGIKFMDKDEYGLLVTSLLVDGKQVKSCKKNGICTISVKKFIPKDTMVYKTTSSSLENDINEILKEDVRKQAVSLNLYKKADDLYLEASVNGLKVTESIKIDQASFPLDEERIIKQLSKFGDSCYVVKNIKINLFEDIYCSIKIINELRRSIINKLDLAILDSYKFKDVNYHPAVNLKAIFKKVDIECVTSNVEQTEAVRDLVDEIYGPGALNYSSRIDDNPCEEDGMVHNLGQIHSQYDVPSPYFNIANTSSIRFLKEIGLEKLYLSTELDINHIKELKLNSISDLNIGLMVYGKRDLMVSKHCIVASSLGFPAKNCGSCLKNKYKLQDEFGNYLPLLLEKNHNCTMRILDYKTLNLINYVNELKKLGITKFLLVFTDEDSSTVRKVTKEYIKALNNEKFDLKIENHTMGAFKTLVE